MLFDIYTSEANQKTDDTLGGGGRYDGLTRALGYGRDVPALGFAYNLDAIVAIRTRELDPSPGLDLVSPVESGSIGSAIQKARELRASGKRAAIDFEDVFDPPSSGNSGDPGEGQGGR
jgi:histidyl-tRNA synthetase